MKIICIMLCALLTACASDMLQNGSAIIDDGQTASRLLYPYESSAQCRGCHTDQYQQYEDSMHAKAFSNPLFNAQYFKDIVPRAQQDSGLIPEARKCLACHAPVVFMNYTGLVTTPAQANRFETGVTCDFCHTLAGFAENGDYQQDPSRKKQGPFQASSASSSHSEYSGFLQLAVFCGRCHNATNHIGLEVKSTYDEWRASDYGKRGFACQECHMNNKSVLSKGTAAFASGPAAYLNIGNVTIKLKDHDKLYSHAFPGAHSISQVENALLLEYRVVTCTAAAGERFLFELLVNNEGCGHKMPSGSSDLRFMWLVVTAAATDGTNIPVLLDTPSSGIGNEYSIAGSSPDDATILEDDVPAGSRLYRTVLVNAEGHQSLFQYDTVKNAFDNRLGAAEIRKEGYYLKLPAGFSGKVTLEANLYYKGAPSSFTRRMHVPDFSAVLVASKKKEVIIEAARASNE